MGVFIIDIKHCFETNCAFGYAGTLPFVVALARTAVLQPSGVHIIWKVCLSRVFRHFGSAFRYHILTLMVVAREEREFGNGLRENIVSKLTKQYMFETKKPKK